MTETTKPPAGLLADAALKAAPVAEEAAPEKTATDTPSPAALPQDPNYKEPTSLAKFRDIHEALIRDQSNATDGQTLEKVSLERKVLIDFLLGRVEVLENALKPFAVTGTMLSNALMSLVAIGSDDPAGGTWVSNPPNGIQLQPTQGYFFNAIDAFGRLQTEVHMQGIFKRVQEANALQAEKQKHVDAGGTVH